MIWFITGREAVMTFPILVVSLLVSARVLLAARNRMAASMVSASNLRTGSKCLSWSSDAWAQKQHLRLLERHAHAGVRARPRAPSDSRPA